MWVTKQVYKQRSKNGDNRLLEKLSVLFIHDWKLHAIIDKDLFWKVENQQGKIQWKTAESRCRQEKWKTNLQTEEKCRINGAWEQGCSTYSVGYKTSEATSRAACCALL